MSKRRWSGRVETLREVAAVAKQGWLIPRIGRTLREHGASQHLVVFVHGYFASSGVFEPLARHLMLEGHAPRQVHFNYTPTGNIAGHAKRLVDTVERVGHGGPVIVVAHSLGGLITRWYAQVLGGRLDALVSIGTPHRGTPRAEGWPMELSRELAPESPALRVLAATRGRLESSSVTSVVAENDLLVGGESAALDGSRVVRVPGTGHHGVLYHPHTWETVVDAIREVSDEPERPRSTTGTFSTDSGRASDAPAPEVDPARAAEG